MLNEAKASFSFLRRIKLPAIVDETNAPNSKTYSTIVTRQYIPNYEDYRDDGTYGMI